MSTVPWIGALTDDGAEAEGYVQLLWALLSSGWHVEALAPERCWISSGTAVALEAFSVDNTRPIQRLPYPAGSAEFGIDIYNLTPAAISRIACARAKQAGNLCFPDCCIVAGVNHGPNVGENLIHSGTFSAALVAFWLGQAAVAVSLDDVHSVDEASPGPLRFAAAARIAVAAVEWILAQPYPILCNINVPNVDAAETFTIVPVRSQGRPATTSLLRTDIDALREGYVSVMAFPTGSIEPRASLSEAAARGIAGIHRRLGPTEG